MKKQTPAKHPDVKKYTTPDVALDTFVEIRLDEQQSAMENLNGTMLFARPDTAQLRKAVADYFAGATVPAMQFAQLMRQKKAEMYARKRMGV
jgi:hypothetical protein